MIDFNTEPYFDDYSELKDFYRILFRPSYAVQARELTQVQTILQNQVTRFGDHMFKNGSQVIPGSVNVDNRVHFIKLEQFSGTLDVTTFLHTMKDMIITGSTSGVKMRVVDTSNSSYIDKTGINITPTLYCKIEGTASDNETHRFAFGEKLVATTADNSIATNFRLKEDLLELKEVVVKLTGSNGEPATAYTNNSSSDVFGYAMSVDVQPGIYYIDGIFVRNSELKLFPGRFSNNPSARIGFKIIEETITPEDDSSILDNATGSYNFAAPGAHRYKISLSLVSLPLTTEGKTGTDNIRFVELVRVVDGRIQFKKDRATYAELEKTLARRTFDESGNYEVNKFKLSAREHKDNGTNYGVYADGRDDKFVMVVDPGKAYIQGYEVESTASQFLEFQKAREDQVTLEENNHVQRVSEQTVGINIGNYAIVKNVYKTPDLATFQKVYLVNYLQPRPASLRAVITGGVVTSIIIDDGGIGYTSAPTITFANTSAGGSGASVTAVITGGRVTGFTSLVGGSAYTTAPEVRCISNITLGAAPVSSTIVGTARVKTLQLYSSTYTYGQTTEFKLGLFDIQMFNGNSFERDVKSVIGTNANNNFCCDISPNLVSLIGTATSVVGNTTVNGVGTNFGEVLKAGDVLFLNDTYVGVVSTANNLAVTLAAPGAAVAISGGRISVFSSVLNEPNFGTLLFPVGPNVIKTLRGVANGNDTVKSTTITIRRKLTTPTVSTNSVSFELSDGYETFLSDDLQNHTLFCSDTNLPVNTSTANIDFDSDTTRKKITFKQVPAGTYYCIASIQQTSNTAAERRKYVVRSQEQQIVGKKYISAPTIDLPHADILKLVAVYMTPGAPDAYNDSIKVNITDHFTLDNGQRDTFYTNGKLLLKPGYPVPSGALKVVYDYFNIVSTDTGNYFSVDSYRHLIAGVDYDEIPSYSVTDPSTGKKIEVSLADVVDFRPVLVSQSYNYFYPELPKMGSDLISPVANYLGRVDKVVLDSVGKLNVISGVPSADPKEPEDPKDGLVLATVNVPPYTKKVGDVVIKQRDNRRYTMKDIGKLERRISNLEYYVSLNLLEKDTATMQIKDDTTGLDRFKNGFIVDQFTGHNIGDVKNEDYKIAVDSEARVLRPMHNTVAVEVVENLVAGADRAYKDYRKTGDLITLPYTEDTYIFNNNATRAMDIQAMSSGAFKGQVVLVPEGDSWKSITRRPDLVAVDDNNYDAIKYLGEELGVTGTKWNEWQTNWTSITTRVPVRYETSVYTGYASQYIHTGYEATFTDYSGYNWRDGINTSLTSSVNAQDYGDRVVDMSYIPFMRSRPVTFIAQNLKPSTKFFPFFDNTDVSEYVKPADKMTVQRVGTTSLAFDQQSLDNNILNDVPARASDGKVEAAFSVGDVLMTAAEHTPTQITAITRLTIASPSFNITVNKQDNILPGHHVVLYNLDFHIAYDEKNYDELHENQIIPASSGIVANTSTSKQLNLRKFKVLATSGKVITLGNIDGTDVEAFDAYSTDSYDVGSFGMVYRLKASAVVAHGGQVTSTDTYGNLVQEIFLVNVKNGFAINETLQGTVTIGTSSAYNGVTVKYINGANSATSASPLLAKGDAVITDSEGTAVGVFYLPETAALSFRTGERTFKLTDNQSNSSSAFDSVGTSVYYAQGISLSKERTIVSTRTAEFVQTPAYEDTQNLPPVRRTTTSIKQIYQWVQDPLAQTFDVSADGGVFVTSVDLYFATLGKRPVSIELRNTDNGVPSTKVVPFSKVTKSIGELTASTKGETATRFTFKSPVYLQDAETYALVVMTDEPGTQIFVSEMGQKDLITKNDIVGQPLTGSLYASQNSKEWEIHSLLDMKFTLNKAKFDIATTSEVILKATTPELYKLPDNPFEITPGTNKIRVWAPDHGLLANDIVVISNVARDSYGTSKTDPLKLGISSKLLNAAHTVLSTGLEKDSFIIDLVTVDGSGNSLLSGANTDFVKGYYGGSGVMCSRGINMDVMYLKTSDLNFQETTLSYSVMAHKASDPTSAGFTSYLPVVANSNFNFPTRMHIASYENQIVENSTKQPDLLIKASLYSSNANISPAIDMQQFSVFAISNLVNKSSAATINVAAIDTRKVLAGNDISLSNTELSGTGTITSSTSSTTVTGTSTVFTTQVVGGNKLYTTESTPRLIGTVASTPGSNTSLTLTGNAAIAYTGGFYVSSTPSLIFENVNGVGIIRTNIDSADNQLSSAGIGKTLTISGVDPTNVDGTYVVTNIIVEDDSSTYAGNSELDKIKVYLDRAFGASSTTIDMTTDTDFNISVLDRYVEDFAPVGAYNFANYITRTLSLTESADTIKIMFDANIVNKTDIKVYYRTWSGNVDLRKIPYVDSGFSATSYVTEGKFMERNIDISGIASFNNLSVKIVFKSTDPVSVPKIKNLRILALS
jgi:hypothetical protein